MRDQSDMRGEQFGLGVPQRGEATPMGRRRAEATEGFEMLGGGISFMDRESVAGIKPVQFGHGPVAEDFRDNASGRDGVTAAVALDEGSLRERHRAHEQAVDQHVDRRGIQSGKGEVHGAVGGAQDVGGVDGGRVNFGDGERELVMKDTFEEAFALSVTQLLGIVQSDQVLGQTVVDPTDGQDHGGGHHGPRQRAAAGLIDSGQGMISLSDELTLELEAVNGGAVRHGLRVPLGGAACQEQTERDPELMG
jgi:hypothetical protein